MGVAWATSQASAPVTPRLKPDAPEPSGIFFLMPPLDSLLKTGPARTQARQVLRRIEVVEHGRLVDANAS
ncbi:hypothetical protein Poly30_31460 [Planctomycetes bacterium Poly30]|uniref:Uncharacterized protein n=1 Tax=Saltatorellus ferox TaxID=2528018 RepID=A0A518EU90_9BACT|nr:hypothetical protein Poly30_31460 [Planctomycetes bacterium Poly30]